MRPSTIAILVLSGVVVALGVGLSIRTNQLTEAEGRILAAQAAATQAKFGAQVLIAQTEQEATRRIAERDAAVSKAEATAAAALARAEAALARVRAPLVVRVSIGPGDAAGALTAAVTSTAVVAVVGPRAAAFSAGADATHVRITPTNADTLAGIVTRLPAALNAADAALQAYAAASVRGDTALAASDACEESRATTTEALTRQIATMANKPAPAPDVPFWSLSMTAGGLSAAILTGVGAGAAGYFIGAATGR